LHRRDIAQLICVNWKETAYQAAAADHRRGEVTHGQNICAAFCTARENEHVEESHFRDTRRRVSFRVDGSKRG
jgi:hypothetical protein